MAQNRISLENLLNRYSLSSSNSPRSSNSAIPATIASFEVSLQNYLSSLIEVDNKVTKGELEWQLRWTARWEEQWQLVRGRLIEQVEEIVRCMKGVALAYSDGAQVAKRVYSGVRNSVEACRDGLRVQLAAVREGNAEAVVGQGQDWEKRLGKIETDIQALNNWSADNITGQLANRPKIKNTFVTLNQKQIDDAMNLVKESIIVGAGNFKDLQAFSPQKLNKDPYRVGHANMPTVTTLNDFSAVFPVQGCYPASGQLPQLGSHGELGDKGQNNGRQSPLNFKGPLRSPRIPGLFGGLKAQAKPDFGDYDIGGFNRLSLEQLPTKDARSLSSGKKRIFR